MRDRVDSNNISILYYSKDHIIADLFTKYLHRALSVKFLEVIMTWKQMDTLHIGPPSIKKIVGNIDEVESIKEVIKSNI